MLAGCSRADASPARHGGSPPSTAGTASGGVAPAPPPSLGDTTLNADARDLRVLVVGDSWAKHFGAGMAATSHGRGVTIINAAHGRCGILLPYKTSPPTTVSICNAWPTKWPALVAKYKPNVVWFSTSFWDPVQQDVDGSGTLRNIGDPTVRARYDRNADRAPAAASYLAGVLLFDPAHYLPWATPRASRSPPWRRSSSPRCPTC